MISKNQIKRITGLHRKKERDEARLFLAEGVKLVTELLLEKPGQIESLFVTEDFAAENSQILKNRSKEFTVVSEQDLKKISLLTTPNGALAVCSYFPLPSSDFEFENKFTFYLDDIRDPGNLGTIIRLADWYGINKIFCSANSVDYYNPKVIQSTMGAFLRVECVYLDLNEVIRINKVKNVFGAVLNGKDIYASSLSGGLIVIGNEANGISSGNMKLINYPVTIPAHRHNGTESLNAAIATAIIASEFYRKINY